MSALKAELNCCEEAAMFSSSAYIPCNAPATKVVGWRGRSDPPILMCDACADHNFKNRYGLEVGDYTPMFFKAKYLTAPDVRHVYVRVFAASAPEATYGAMGSLTLRKEEFEAFKRACPGMTFVDEQTEPT